MPLDLILAYALACIVIVVIPGPSVTLIVANSLAHGARGGLLTVAGSQVGILVAITAVGIGLTSFVETMGHWFEGLRFVGAAYLVWLGFKMLRAPAKLDAVPVVAAPRGGFALQGLLVAVSNPKTLVFFGAFLPQFLDPSGDHVTQIALLGTTFLVIAGASDSIYALLAGRAGAALTGGRMRWVNRLGGCFLIGGGAWLVLARSR
jgi:homoserine/homoserine lactone efflux protein